MGRDKKSVGVKVMKGTPTYLSCLGKLVAHQQHPNEGKEGLLCKRFWIGIVIEEVLILVEEQVIVKMMVNKGDTWNTFPKMIVQHHRDCQISHEPLQKIQSAGAALREWFCKGADMTSATEYEAALCQLEDDPPDIRQYNVNIREERWTNFSLEGVKFQL